MKAEITRALRHLFRMPATVLAVAGLGLGLGLSAHADTAQPLGVAFVYLGNPGDAGWTYAHEQGVKAIEAQFGNKIKVTRVENVPESADSERVFRDLAAKATRSSSVAASAIRTSS